MRRTLFFVGKSGRLGQLTQEDWYKDFAANAGKEKVVEEYPRSRYIDDLSLVRFEGDWRIVNKVYTSERK